MPQEFRPGDRVVTPEGEPGRVASVDGRYLVVREDSGYSWRGLAEDVRRMEMETTMAMKPGDLRDGDEIEYRAAGQTRRGFVIGRPDSDPRTRVWVARKENPDQDDWVSWPDIVRKVGSGKFDATRVSVGADGSATVTVDPEGDEARAGLMDARGALRECGICGKNIRVDDRGNFKQHAGRYGGPCTGSGKYAGMSTMSLPAKAGCPYCRKTVAMSRGALGHHRSATGVCLGADKPVARVSGGRAVLMAKDPKFGPLPPAITVKYLPANQAYLILWNGQRIAGPLSERDTRDYLKTLWSEIDPSNT